MRIQHSRSRRIHFILACTLALVAAAFCFSSSSAHAYLVRSEPSDDLVLSESPTDIRLWFDEPVSGKFSSAQLIDPNGQPVQITSIRVDPGEPKLMIIGLPELSPGAYSLLYKALSETDGHFSQGLLVFGIGEEADLAAARTVEAAPLELPLPEVGLRWLNFAVLAGVVGAVAMAQLVLGPSHLPANAGAVVITVLHSARRRVAGLALGFCILGLVVGTALLLWQIRQLMASLPGGADPINVGRQILTDTRWGYMWLLRQLSLLLLLPLLIGLYRLLSYGRSQQAQVGEVVLNGVRRNIVAGASWREGIIWSLADMLALTLVVVQSLTSHASGLEDNTLLAILADALHLLAASLWVGGLLSMMVGLVPLLVRQRAELLDIIRAGWKPFSVVAVLSVAILFATGFYNTGRQVASADALFTTLYGRTLMVKIAVVISVGAIGLLNSMLLYPKLATPLAMVFRRPTGWTPLPLRRLPTLVVVEVSVGILVLFITGVITSSAAPRGIEYSIEPEEIPGSLSQTADDLVVTLNVKPNRPGQNVFSVFARSIRRPPPAEIARVILRFDYLGKDIDRVSATAEQVAPDRFILAGNYLNVGGEWLVQVVVRRLGLEDGVATFKWIVVPPGDIRPTLVSREPLEPITTLVAAAILLFVAMAAIVGWAAADRSWGISQLVDEPQEGMAVPQAMPSLSHMNTHESGDLAEIAWHHETSGD